MIKRTYDIIEVTNAVRQYADEIDGFNPKEWLDSEENVALSDENGNVALFEREMPGVVTGHYFFYCRGRDAVKLSHEVLKEIFTGPYDVQVIRGLTPVENRGAIWMSRHIGFKSYGTVETHVGPCVLFILTKEEWRERHEKEIS